MLSTGLFFCSEIAFTTRDLGESSSFPMRFSFSVKKNPTGGFSAKKGGFSAKKGGFSAKKGGFSAKREVLALRPGAPSF